ncbi:hypothetical protein A2U01_0077862, partial [Trifolium medium]|nr:hypothetical protein [Trifolium medium]
PLPSYYQLYPQPADLAAHFQRQTTRLVEHQTHIRGIWDQEYDAHHHQQQPPQQDASDDEMDCEIDAALQYFTAPGGSSSQGGH